MNSDAQISALSVKRDILKQAIAKENLRPHPDDIRIVELKKEKLKLKDQIHDLELHEHPEPAERPRHH